MCFTQNLHTHSFTSNLPQKLVLNLPPDQVVYLLKAIQNEHLQTQEAHQEKNEEIYDILSPNFPLHLHRKLEPIKNNEIKLSVNGHNISFK